MSSQQQEARRHQSTMINDIRRKSHSGISGDLHKVEVEVDVTIDGRSRSNSPSRGVENHIDVNTMTKDSESKNGRNSTNDSEEKLLGEKSEISEREIKRMINRAISELEEEEEGSIWDNNCRRLVH